MPRDTASTFRFRDPDAELFAKLAEIDRIAAPMFAKRKGSWVPGGPWAGLADSMGAAKYDAERYGEDR